MTLKEILITFILPHLPRVLFFLKPLIFMVIGGIFLYLIKKVIDWGINQIKKSINDIKVIVDDLKTGQGVIKEEAKKGRSALHLKIETLVKEKIDPCVQDIGIVKAECALKHKE